MYEVVRICELQLEGMEFMPCVNGNCSGYPACVAHHTDTKKNKSELTSPNPLTIQSPISKNRTLRTPVKTRSKSKYQFDQDEEDEDVVDENEVTLEVDQVEEVGGSPTNVSPEQRRELIKKWTEVIKSPRLMNTENSALQEEIEQAQREKVKKWTQSPRKPKENQEVTTLLEENKTLKVELAQAQKEINTLSKGKKLLGQYVSKLEKELKEKKLETNEKETNETTKAHKELIKTQKENLAQMKKKVESAEKEKKSAEERCKKQKDENTQIKQMNDTVIKHQETLRQTILNLQQKIKSVSQSNPSDITHEKCRQILSEKNQEIESLKENANVYDAKLKNLLSDVMSKEKINMQLCDYLSMVKKVNKELELQNNKCRKEINEGEKRGQLQVVGSDQDLQMTDPQSGIQDQSGSLLSIPSLTQDPPNQDLQVADTQLGIDQSGSISIPEIGANVVLENGHEYSGSRSNAPDLSIEQVKTVGVEEDVVRSMVPIVEVKTAEIATETESNKQNDDVSKEAPTASSKTKDNVSGDRERSQKRPCFFYNRNGYCKFENECIYYHDKGKGPAKNDNLTKGGTYAGTEQQNHKRNQPCLYLSQGYCHRGMNCKYDHNTAKQDDKVERPVCKLYLKGNCKNGVNCSFKHVIKTKANSNSKTCKFFQKGWCKWGEECKYSHTTERQNRQNEYTSMSKNWEGKKMDIANQLQSAMKAAVSSIIKNM